MNLRRSAGLMLFPLLLTAAACGKGGSDDAADRPTGRVSSYVALPARLPAPGVLVLHSWWGLVPDMKAYADRLADAGYVALAPDLYGDGSTASTVAEATALVAGHDDALLADRALAALNELLSRDDVTGAKAAVVGFSLGGGAAATLATQSAPTRVAALVIYYDARPALPWARLHAPLLSHYAATDAYTDPADVSGLQAALKTSSADSRSYVYRGTRHWFAEPSRPEYRRPQAALALHRTIRLLATQLPTPGLRPPGGGA